MGEKILIVDDDATMVKLLSTILEIDGFEPSTALSGPEALEMIHREKPDLVLLDIMMPEMDGFEVLARLRSDPAYEDLPVIMLTARTEDRDIFEGWRKGADEYVTKPFDPRKLVETIRVIISRSREERLEERARKVESLLALLEKAEEEGKEEENNPPISG
jgi:two-component system alkaline phosphatase synthesis response regulator PhoP/two-component system response regulator VicR